MSARPPTGPPVGEAVVIGGSAGALPALEVLLASLPEDFEPPVVLVVHLPRHPPSPLAQALARVSPLPVREPWDKEPLARSTVYVAPAGYHLLIDRGPAFSFSTDPPVSFAVPSIDVLFESAADCFGERLAGVILSGANADGARGLWAIREAGGLALVQDPEEAASRAMPDAALAICPDAQVLFMARMGSWLRALSPWPHPRGAP